MTALTGEIRSIGYGGVLNPAITSNLDSYGFNWWPPHETDFSKVGRNMLTYNLPVPANGRSVTGRVGGSFYGDYYNRIHLTPQSLDFGNILEAQSRQLYIWNAYLTTSAFTGYTTTDKLLSVTPLFAALFPLQEFLTAVIAQPGGVNNLDADITFGWTSRPDSLLHVYGTRVAILPYQPNAQWQETHEWITNVIKSYNGTEQRVKLRYYPRTTVEVSYQVPPADRQRAQNLVQGWVNAGWIVPLWTDAAVSGPVATGAMSFNVVNSDSLIQYATELVLWQRHDLYEVVRVGSIVGTTVNLINPVVNDYSRAVVVPVANGVTNTGIVRNTDGYASDLKASYRLAIKPEIDAVTPDQYQGEDIYFTEQIVPNSGKITEDMLTRFDEVTNRIANSKFYTPWLQTQHSRIYTIFNTSKQETLNFKRWLARRSGKFRPFWTPTFEPDFTLSQIGNITTALIVVDNGYSLYQRKRKHLAILKTDGTWVTREILSYGVPTGGLMNLNLDTALNFDASLVKMICFLGLKRLDTDRVEIFFPGGGNSYASLRIVEIES